MTDKQSDANDHGHTISLVTRRDIKDYLVAERIAWWGRLSETDFLSRMWNLDLLPSTDPRPQYPDADADIRQHRINNDDWDDDWIFQDERFLEGCSDQTFVAFLCETLHPLVRSDDAEVARLLGAYSECLKKDGWEIAQVGQLSGRPIFEGRRRGSVRQAKDGLALERRFRLDDPQFVRDFLEKIERDLLSDPSGAIGTCKELVETIFKSILDDYGVKYSRKDDLPSLYKKVQKELRLNVESVPGDKPGSEAAMKALRSLTATVQSLAELRNKLGTGHGRSKRSPALTRHARLAFNATVGLVEFLLDTWHERFELLRKLEMSQSFDESREHIANLTTRGPMSDPELKELVRVANENFQIYGAHEYSPEAVGGRLWPIVNGRESACSRAAMAEFSKKFAMSEEDIPF